MENRMQKLRARGAFLWDLTDDFFALYFAAIHPTQ